MRGTRAIVLGRTRAAGAVALAVAVVLAAAPALAQQPTVPRPAIAVQPRTVTYGETAVLTGTLVNGPADAGTPVALLRRAIPAEQVYHEVARMTAGPAGDFRFSLQPTANAYYAVRTRSEPVQTSLGLLVRVTPRIELRLPERPVRRGQLVRFVGTVRPDLSGTLVRVQRRRDGRWETVARTRLAPARGQSSSFAVGVRVRRPGIYRVSVPATASLSRGASAPRRVRVRA